MSIDGTQYQSESLQHHEGLEGIRKRPSMYIGGIGSRGLHHLVKELLDNSIDEAIAGHCDKVEVQLHPDGSVSVSDNGRGIPVDQHKQSGISGVELVMTKVHAGGKFDSGAYVTSGGLHGVGVSAVNALSRWLEVTVERNGTVYRQRYERGKTTTELEEIGTTEQTGTSVRFKPDPDIFETVEFDPERLSNMLEQLAYLNPRLAIRLIDESRDLDVTYHEEDGIKAYVAHLNRNDSPLYEDVIYFDHETTIESEEPAEPDRKVNLEVALQHCKESPKERIFTFANNINTAEGGTHLTGFKTALTRVINQYAQQFELVGEDTSFSGEDVREGLTAVLSIFHSDPQFESQTKVKLQNSNVRGVVERAMGSELHEYMIEHPDVAKLIVQRAETARKARQAAQRAKKDVRRKSAFSSGRLPGKLADCSSTDRDQSELFIVEGDSAGGSAKQGRNREFQAILPLKGKILNVEKARLDRVLDNKEIRSMITALGTDIGDDFDISKLRYGKVILMTDADVDGAHIRTLLMTLFFRYMRELIEEGNLFIAQPPLYRVSLNGREEYVYKEDQLPGVLDEYGGNPSVQRYKGLGEMNPGQLLETTMNPENRNLLQVTMQDAVEADELFTTLMGDDVEPRRQFIQQHADDVTNLDV